MPKSRVERTGYISWRALVIAAPAACWAIGAIAFLRADGAMSWTLPQQAPVPQGEHNLASYQFGPTLRASSYYRAVLSQHHPAFVLDGRAHPTELEKWTSSPRDLHPWLELTWREARQLMRVEIVHAGAVESDDFTARRYRLRCLRDQPEAPILEVHDNQSDVARHTFPCADAKGLRIEWTPNRTPDPLIRVYEVEAWGR